MFNVFLNITSRNNVINIESLFVNDSIDNNSIPISLVFKHVTS